jgi:O-methyltransferase
VNQSLAGKLLRALVGSRGAIVAPLASGWQRERRLIKDTRAKTQLLLTDPAALHLLACARAARPLPGVFAEAGVFRGGSARLICEEKGDGDIHLFDVFETLQDRSTTPSAEQVRAHFGSVHGCETQVRELLAGYPNVHFHTGVFPESARGLQDDLRFSFVHLDMDLVAPTLAALEFFLPRLVQGGIVLVDDYCDRFLKSCVDEWFAGRAETLIELPWSQAMAIRQGG